MKRIAPLIRMAATLTLLMTAGNALAQSEDSVTISQLRDELAERDKIIIDLLHRVEALENRLAAKGGISSQTEAVAEAQAAKSTDQLETGRSFGGDFEIDLLAAERALERSLVQEGARLLGPGQLEIVLGSVYSRSEASFPTLVTLDDNGFVGEVGQEADVFDWYTGFRLGLPFDSQLEVTVPYRTVRTDTELRLGGAVQSTSGRSGSGLGDISVGLAKRLLDEESWRPNLVGRLEWLTGTGEEEDGGLALGGGNEALGVNLSASWRRDPVVFLLGGGFTNYFDADAGRLQPGDRFDLSLGTALAVSPETALIFSIDQSFSQEFELDGVELHGSDRQSALFNVSASTILARGILLQLNAGVGLTEDAPDYQIGVSVPVRIDIF